MMNTCIDVTMYISITMLNARVYLGCLVQHWEQTACLIILPFIKLDIKSIKFINWHHV